MFTEFIPILACALWAYIAVSPEIHCITASCLVLILFWCIMVLSWMTAWIISLSNFYFFHNVPCSYFHDGLKITAAITEACMQYHSANFLYAEMLQSWRLCMQHNIVVITWFCLISLDTVAWVNCANYLIFGNFSTCVWLVFY